MAIFRADHYLVAEFKEVSDVMATGEKVLQALREVPELKDLAIVSKRMEGRQWSEIVGSIDVPEGSRAFWAMVKRELSNREPYHLFIRLDRNAQGTDIEDAREFVRKWAENSIVPKIQGKTPIKTIKVLQAIELYMPPMK
ncbi:MAG: hypothetical protein ACFFD3_07670 [Candidatus Thorarchaeota archaeon]